jgi:hypothetical protein
MVNLYISSILEGVFAMQIDTIDSQVVRLHKGIFCSLHFQVRQMSILAVPKRFGCIGQSEVFEMQSVQLSEHFWSIHEAVSHADMFAIPEWCTIRGGKMASATQNILALPQDIHSLEFTIMQFDMPRLFESRFAVAYGHTLQSQIAASVQWAFAR